MPENPLVSIVIPVRDRAHLISRALASVERQTYRPIEIVAVDDGSVDKSSEVVRAFPTTLPCRIIRHDHSRGAPAARNTGIDNSAGEFIAFLDSDDAFLPDRTALAVAALIDGGPECGLVHCGWLRASVTGGLISYVPSYPREDEQAILRSNFVGATAAATIRKDLLVSIGGFDESLQSCQDWDLFIRLARVARFACVSAPGFIQCDHPGEKITSSQQRRAAGLAQIYRKHLREVVRRDIGARKQFKRYMADVAYRSGRIRLAAQLFARSMRPGLHRKLVDPWPFVALLRVPPDTYDKLTVAAKRLHAFRRLAMMSGSERRALMAAFRKAITVPEINHRGLDPR